MNTLDAIRKRRSVRKFLDKKVDNEKIGILLEAFKWGPSAGNRQPWDIVVVDNKEKIEKFSEIALNQSWIKKAPLLMVVCINQRTCGTNFGLRGQSIYCFQSTAAATQNLMLTATDIGLGTCWVDPYDEKAVSELLGCPSHIKPIIAIAVGYPSETPKSTRHEINTFSHYNSYGNSSRETFHSAKESFDKAKKGLLESLRKF